MKQFAIDIDQGLSEVPKKLSSKYFYDKRGDELFIEIMKLPEYYLTNSEMEILSKQSDTILKSMGLNGDYFEVYELGAGDGTKTIKFLESLKGKDFKFHPIDISSNAINQIELNYQDKDWLNMEGIVGDYFEVLKTVNSETNKVVLFLGSNLGNMTDEQATQFMNLLDSSMSKGDYLLLGLDLIKDESIIGPAYNDSKGVTSEFNLNLLKRINRELGANFNVDSFCHSPEYDAENGIAFSYIESTKNQTIKIERLSKEFSFKKGEKIHTEISRKYNDEILENILNSTQLNLIKKFTDEKEYYANYLIKKN
jgi:dimethylhistidine N-methyltransferase